MGCPSECFIGDNLVFSICCHDPDTGILTDASSTVYHIYEDETATPVASGSLAKLNDANTTGFYSELVAVTAANGYEDGKNYTVYIEATVDGDMGGIAYTFKAIDYSNIVAAIIAGVADGSYDLQEILRILLARASGPASGGGSGRITFEDPTGGTARIAMTVDKYGNRSNITLDGS